MNPKTHNIDHIDNTELCVSSKHQHCTDKIEVCSFPECQHNVTWDNKGHTIFTNYYWW